ncbi:predicted beta-glucoside transporter [Vibrio variabilis]|uniref:Predicted beta-glucoside transporter n=1 Tax=Vibrio variabilis TaxID=990271 RepID=A0ABQ0JHG0_9VIBR|nr:predicted beta-glucoside transporter [Vibrio variabilis]
MEQAISVARESTNGSGKLSMTEKVGYSLGDMLVTLCTCQYDSLGYFYTIFMLDAATVASIFLVVRIFDAINDPLIGYFVDRTQSRWGQCRPWILFVCVPYAISSVLVFSVPDLGETAKEIYAYATYAALMLLFTMTNIPYGALTAKMTSDPVERESLNSMRFMFATGGGLVITSVTLPLAEWISDDPAIGYKYAMTIMAAIAVVMFVITFLTTKERVVEAREESDEKKDIKESLKLLWKNKEFVLLTITTFVMVSSQVAKGTVQMFYINDYAVDGAKYVTYFLSAWMVGGMIGAKLASKVLEFMDKKKAWIMLQIVSAVLSLMALVIGNENMVLIVGLSFFVGFANQMIAPIWFTYCSDTQDYSELKFGKRQDGLALSFVIFALKMGLSVGGAIAMWSLSLYGYESGGVEQTAEAIDGVLTTFSVVPAIGFLITAFFISKISLDSKTISRNSKELESLRAR